MNSIACICDLGFRTRTQKSSNCCIKTFRKSPKNRGGGNSAKVWVKKASSETIIVFLVYWTRMHCCGSVKYLFFVCLVISLPGCQQLHLKYVSCIFLQWLEIHKNQGSDLLKKTYKVQLVRFFEKNLLFKRIVNDLE